MLNTPPCPCRQIYVSNSNGVNSNASNTRFKSVAPVIVSNSNGVNSNAFLAVAFYRSNAAFQTPTE